MFQESLKIGAACALVGLAACSAGSVQSSLEPKVTSINPVTNSTLQFAVGTVKFSDGSLGLNAVETLRQTAAGYVGTSVLTNAPTIVGPAGFTVPTAPDAYGDAGTNSISGTLYTSLASPPPSTTFDPTGAEYTGIASSSGIFPSGSTNSSNAPNLSPYPEPFYAAEVAPLVAQGIALGGDATTPLQLNYIGGPPSFVASGHTSTQDGTFPSGDYGYSLGFNSFGVTPLAGTYTLNVVIPTGISTTTGVSTTSTVSKTAVLALNSLPTWAVAPTFVPDGAGGGTITTNYTAGGNVTEEFVLLVDLGPGACQTSGAAPYYYTFKVTPGTATIAVPDDIGAAPVGKAATHTICTAGDNAAGAPPYTTDGDSYAVYGVAADYPLLESTFPASTGNATPAITTSGQDDVALSAATVSDYAGTFGGLLESVSSVHRSNAQAGVRANSSVKR